MALCAKAKFADARQDLRQEQKELLDCFKSPDKQFAFSNFNDIVKNVDHLASHFTDEILEAQRKKLYKLHIDAFRSLDKVNKANTDEIDRIIAKFQICRRNVNNFFNSSQNRIKTKLRSEINEMMNKIEKKGCSYIDDGFEGDTLKNIIEQYQKDLSGKLNNRISTIINNELIDLKKNIEKEISTLRESFTMSSIHSNFSTPFNINLNDVVSQLDFKFGDLVNWGVYLGSSIMLGWTIAAASNWWNPVGWGLAAVGALIAIIGDSKEDKAKAKLRESISEAKNNIFTNEWPKMTSEMDRQFKSKANSFDQQMKSVIADFKAIKTQMNSIVMVIKKNSLKFK